MSVLKIKFLKRNFMNYMTLLTLKHHLEKGVFYFKIVIFEYYN
jgi:hypothetical protein